MSTFVSHALQGSATQILLPLSAAHRVSDSLSLKATGMDDFSEIYDHGFEPSVNEG